MLNKDALAYLVELGESQKFNVDCVVYQNGKPIEKPSAEPLHVRTLTAICEYITHDVDKNGELLVKVDADKVAVLGPIDPSYKTRDTLMIATMPKKDIPFGQFRPVEDWIITLQTAFERSDDWGKVMALIGNVADCQTKQFSDDGLSQCVTAQTSVASKANVAVPSLVTLVPMIGFPDAGRVKGTYVLRARGGSENSKPTFALFEADAAEYQAALINKTGSWLTDALTGVDNAHVIY